MPRIIIITPIKASPKIVFDLSRSIDFHKVSTAHTNEEAIAGVTTGLISLEEQVTWRAKHFGFYQTLTSKITAFEPYTYFVDEMVEGAFKCFKHEHIFKETAYGTELKNIFDYTFPGGSIGRFIDHLFLKRYMSRLLDMRNQHIKRYAESDAWKTILKNP